MDQPNQSSSSPLNQDSSKRKRGRPRREDCQTQQPVNPPEENLIGKVVSGVVEGSFEAGYLLNVKVAGTEKQLRGLVFLPDKVTPVTQETDLFPQAKMYPRENILVPSIDQQALLQGNKNVGNQAGDIGSEPQTGALIADKNQSTCTALLPGNFPMIDAGGGSMAISERNDLIDTPMKDVDGTALLPGNFPMSDAGGGSMAMSERNDLIDTPMKDADGCSAGPVGQNLPLRPQFASDDKPKEDESVLRSEAFAASKKAVTVTTTSSKDSIAKGSTTLVDFIPAHEQAIDRSKLKPTLELFQNETTTELSQKQVTDSSMLNLEVSQNEITRSGTEDEIQLELGNKKMSALCTATEAKPNQSDSSKSGFLTDVFEGREETVKEREEPNPASGINSPEAKTQ